MRVIIDAFEMEWKKVHLAASRLFVESDSCAESAGGSASNMLRFSRAADEPSKYS